MDGQKDIYSDGEDIKPKEKSNKIHGGFNIKRKIFSLISILTEIWDKFLSFHKVYVSL